MHIFDLFRGGAAKTVLLQACVKYY